MLWQFLSYTKHTLGICYCISLAAPDRDLSVEPIKPDCSKDNQVIDLSDDSVVVPHCESDDVMTAFLGSSIDDHMIKTDQSNLVELEKPRECLLFEPDFDLLIANGVTDLSIVNHSFLIIYSRIVLQKLILDVWVKQHQCDWMTHIPPIVILHEFRFYRCELIFCKDLAYLEVCFVLTNRILGRFPILFLLHIAPTQHLRMSSFQLVENDNA